MAGSFFAMPRLDPGILLPMPIRYVECRVEPGYDVPAGRCRHD